MKAKRLQPSDSKPNRKPVSKVFIILGIVIILVAAAVINILLKTTAPKPKEVTAFKAVPSVRVITVEKSPRTLTVTTQGTIEPRTETTLVSEVSGKIVEVSSALDSGAFFQKDDILLKIDDRDYQTALVSAIAQVAQAEADLVTEQAEAEQAKIDWNQLGNGEQPSDLLLRMPQLARAEATLASARAAVEKARNDLERTKIQAPYNGRTRNKMAEIGQFVGVGSQLGSIFATDYVEIRLPLSDVQLGKLTPEVLTYRQKEWQDGPPVVLTAQVAGKPQEWSGRITRLEGVVDSKSRFYYAIARVDDPYGMTSSQNAPLTVGMFVEANIEGRQIDSVSEIPRSAIHPGNRIYVVDNQNQLQIHTVKIVSQSKNTALVDTGLQNGDRIATTPLATPINGMSVKIVEAKEAPQDMVNTLQPAGENN